MSKTVRRKFTSEFKHNVVRVSRLNEFPLSVIAHSFGISTSTLKKWIQEDEDYDSLYKPLTFQVGEIFELLQANEQLAEMHQIFEMQEKEMNTVREINLELQYAVEIFASAIDFLVRDVQLDLSEIDAFINFAESTYGRERILRTLGLIPSWHSSIRLYEKNTALVHRSRVVASFLEKDSSQSWKESQDTTLNSVSSMHNKNSSPKPRTKREKPAIEEFLPDTPLQLWVADITQVKIDRRSYYTFFIMDVYSRKIVGYNISSRAPRSFPREVFEEACQIHGCDPAEVRKDSAKLGSDHLSLVYTAAMEKRGIAPDFATKCSRTVNARAKGLLASFHNEMVTHPYKHKHEDPVEDIKEYINWYNDERIHSSLGYNTPREHESQYYAQMNPVSVYKDSINESLEEKPALYAVPPLTDR